MLIYVFQYAVHYSKYCCGLRVSVSRPTSSDGELINQTLQNDTSAAQGYMNCNNVELGIMVIKCSINKVL